MKICVFVQNLYTLGGVQRVVTTIMNELVKDSSYEVTVVMPIKSYEDKKKLFIIDPSIHICAFEQLIEDKRRTLSKYILAINKRVHYLRGRNGNQYIRRFYYSDRDRENTIKFINRNNFDVVIGTGFEYTILIGDIADKINSKTIGWQHSTYDYYFEKRGVAGYGIFEYAKTCFQNLDSVWVLTESDKTSFDKKLGIGSKVLYNPVQRMNAKETYVPTGRLLFAGRLEKDHKGIDYLLDILKQVKRQIPNFVCDVVGDGKDKRWFLKNIEVNNLIDNINYIGNTDNMTYYYQNADVMLQTSRWEGFGMTITEAMSAGLPVVAFHNLGPDEIINDKVNGYLIEKFDIDSFAQAVVQLLTQESLRASIGTRGVERSKDFSLDVILPIFKEYLMS